MDPLLKIAAEYSPALVAGVVVTLFVIVTLLKFFGFSGIGDKHKLVDESKLSAVSVDISTVNQRLTTIDNRLSAVERDMPNRATREDVHRVELKNAEIRGEIRAQSATLQAMQTAIGRMEDGVYEAARRFGQREAELSDREADLRQREIEARRQREVKGAASV